MITGRNEVLAKVMFLQASVILSTGGGVSAPNFRGGVCSKFSGGASKFSGGGSSNFQNTVRPVRILLECILVINLNVLNQPADAQCRHPLKVKYQFFLILGWLLIYVSTLLHLCLVDKIITGFYGTLP